MKSFLRCLYCPLKTLLQVYLIYSPIVKIQLSQNYFLSNVQLWYNFVSIIDKLDSNSLRFSRHSLALGLDERVKVMYYFPNFWFNWGKNLMTWHRFKNSTEHEIFLLGSLAFPLFLFHTLSFDNWSTIWTCYFINFSSFYQQITLEIIQTYYCIILQVMKYENMVPDSIRNNYDVRLISQSCS